VVFSDKSLIIAFFFLSLETVSFSGNFEDAESAYDMGDLSLAYAA
jgi:hypothetical protein